MSGINLLLSRPTQTNFGNGSLSPVIRSCYCVPTAAEENKTPVPLIVALDNTLA